MAKNAWRTQAQRQVVRVIKPSPPNVGTLEIAMQVREAVLAPPLVVKPNAESVRIQAQALLAKSPEELAKLHGEFVCQQAHGLLRRQMPQEVRPVPQLKVGDLILRSVRILGGDYATKEVMEISFGRSEDRKSRTFKARREWEFAPNEWVASEMTGRGVVCFSEEEPPRGWTHFVVTKLGKKGTTAEVRPCKPDTTKLFAKFREPGQLVEAAGHAGGVDDFKGTLSGS